MKHLAIMGSTGSIGRSTLSVVESFPDRFQVATLAAGRNLDLAFDQAQRWRPQIISVATESDAAILKSKLNSTSTEVVSGPEGAVRVATHPDADFVVSAIVGVAGLEATYQDARAPKTPPLATKESLLPPANLTTSHTPPPPTPPPPTTT